MMDWLLHFGSDEASDTRNFKPKLSPFNEMSLMTDMLLISLPTNGRTFDPKFYKETGFSAKDASQIVRRMFTT
jgi:hypothetical protein